jgi:hypothetical protein
MMGAGSWAASRMFMVLSILLACGSTDSTVGTAGPMTGRTCNTVGEKAKAVDGCNDCTCLQGAWACTQRVCGECLAGDARAVGDACNTCTCSAQATWACTQTPCAVCPAPWPATDGGGACATGAVWAKDPSSGSCCRYGSTCEAPQAWATFASEAACLPVCGCSDRVDDFTVRQPLACWCATHDCSVGVNAAQDGARAACNGLNNQGFARTSGCGQIEIWAGGGFGASGLIFDLPTGTLVGAYQFSDTWWGQCQEALVTGYIYGDRGLLPGAPGSSCPQVDECLICGWVFGTLPPPCPP